MMLKFRTLSATLLFLVAYTGETSALSQPTSRRSLFRQCAASAATAAFLPVAAANAADCFADCFKNCKTIAPKDLDYCKGNCQDYCEQPDRNDGLSGSVSASGGEVGLLGGTFGQGTVPKGEDKPPAFALPGLDFSSGAGKKLIGY